MESDIRLEIFDMPKKHGFGVAISSLSRGALDYYRERLTIPEDSQTIKVRSERLKFTKTKMAADQFVVAFHSLSLDEQLARVWGKWIKIRESKIVPKVAITLQHFNIVRNGHVLAKAIADQRVIGKLKRVYPGSEEVKTFKRQTLVTKPYYDSIKDYVVELPARPKGNFAGVCGDVQNMRRRKVMSIATGLPADRHPGYRSTTNPGFHK